MRTHIKHMGAAGAAALLSSPALASGEGGGFATVAFHAINLAILLGIIIHFARKPISRALAARADGVTKEIDEAARLHREAKALLDEYEGKMKSLDAEAAGLLAHYRAEGEAEKARLVADGAAEAARIQREAARTVENEIGRARKRIETEIVNAAIVAAEKTIREKLTPADQRRLTGDYLNALEETAAQA